MKKTHVPNYIRSRIASNGTNIAYVYEEQEHHLEIYTEFYDKACSSFHLNTLPNPEPSNLNFCNQRASGPSSMSNMVLSGSNLLSTMISIAIFKV